MRSTRPAFCAVREAIVCHECVRGIVVTESRGAGDVLSSKSRPCERCGGTGYDTETTEAALDRLYRDGLYPWRVDDPVAPRWWCGRSAPSFVDDVEAVVSLGPNSISTAVAIAGEISGKAGLKFEGVTWRVMPWRYARTRRWPVAMGVRPNGDEGCELIDALPKNVHLLDASNGHIVLVVEAIESITVDRRHGEFRTPPNVTDVVVFNRFARASSALMAMVVNADQPSFVTAEAGHGFVHYALFGGAFQSGATVQFQVLDDPIQYTESMR